MHCLRRLWQQLLGAAIGLAQLPEQHAERENVGGGSAGALGCHARERPRIKLHGQRLLAQARHCELHQVRVQQLIVVGNVDDHAGDGHIIVDKAEGVQLLEVVWDLVDHLEVE